MQLIWLGLILTRRVTPSNWILGLMFGLILAVVLDWMPGLTPEQHFRAWAAPVPAPNPTIEPMPTPVTVGGAIQLLPPQPIPSTELEQQAYLVIRLSDRRVYLYQNHQLESSYPIAIGRAGWETPTGQYQVIQMIRNPAWQHPFTGEIIPPGPENPLGDRWIGFWTDGTNFIGFHGTPNEETVGTAASHGCIRMLNQDVLKLFDTVQIGTPVIVAP